MQTATQAGPRGLLTYSFVSQGIYGVDDRLSGILPFFLPIIKEMQGRAFDPQEFVTKSNEVYPWSMNTDICHELIPRFCRAGWLKEYNHGKSSFDRSYIVLSISDYDVDEERLRMAAHDLAEIGSAFHDSCTRCPPFNRLPMDLRNCKNCC